MIFTNYILLFFIAVLLTMYLPLIIGLLIKILQGLRN